MKLSIPKKTLERALSRVASVTARKSSMPILETVLVVAEGERVTLSATDLYLGAITTASAKVSEPGSFCVPSRTLADIVKNAPEGDITLASEQGQRLVISAAKSRYRVPTRPADDYPPLPTPVEDAYISLSSRHLADVLDITKVSMSTDDTRPHLAGVKLEWDRNVLRAVSTDGHRLAKAEHDRPTRGGHIDVLIPHKGVVELFRLVSEVAKDAKADREVDVGIQVSAGTLFVRGADAVVSIKLADDQFPPYDKVIPKRREIRVTVLREALFDAVKRIQVVSGDKTGGIELVFEKGALHVRSAHPDVGEGAEEIACDHASAPRIVGANVKYLVDALGSMVGDEVVLEQGAGELDPLVIKPTKSDLDVIVVVMPMRIA